MKVVVISDHDNDTRIYPGMIITYNVSPLFGIKMNWTTEISHVKEQEYFVDEQRTGPFALWHHQHHFKVVKGGVLMTDLLNYAIPYGIIGRIANTLLVEKQVKNIFVYRTKAINDLFGKFKHPAENK